MSADRGRAGPDALFEPRRTRNQTVVVLVSVVDRRIVPALRLVSRRACTDSRALHVAVDAVETRRLAADWMDLWLSWPTLHIQDPTGRTRLENVRDAVREASKATELITVVLPELDRARWWHPLLHRGSARRIAAQVQALPGVTAVVVPVPCPDGRWSSRSPMP